MGWQGHFCDDFTALRLAREMQIQQTVSALNDPGFNAACDDGQGADHHELQAFLGVHTQDSHMVIFKGGLEKLGDHQLVDAFGCQRRRDGRG